LQSGSNGNCIYVETPDVRLLFDAGISAKAAQARLVRHQRDIGDIDAVIISHDHSDHIGSAGVFQRRINCPLYVTAGAWKARRTRLGSVTSKHHFEPGQAIRFSATTVQTIPTAHDGIAGVAFVISHAGKKLGIFTDLGHRFQGIESWISDLDVLYLESNYDPEMLMKGPYPLWLQRRIMGQGGHLSNQEAAELVRDSASRLRLLILAHISQHNNHPELALATVQNVVKPNLPIALSSRSRETEMFVV